MKKLLSLAAAVLLFMGIGCTAVEKAVSAESFAPYPEISEYLREFSARAHIPTMSVIIVDKESVLLSESYGNEVEADAPFLLGSVSKSFTALCIMQLVEAGKIELGAPVSKYLPDCTDGDRITVRQLLNHTSGLGEHQTLSNYHIVGGQGKHVYANVNYSLLGKLIEAASGERYGDYVTAHVFAPLGMENASASENAALVQGTRNYFGFSVPSAPFYPVSESDWIQPAAGYLSASASDLGKYLQMYLKGGGELLSQSGIDAMFEGGVAVEAEIPYTYGMGWTVIKEPLSETVYRHSGLVETGMSCLYLLPERGIGIAVLVNTNDYFVTNDFMDRLDWSIPLLLLGYEPNEIGESEYALRHLMYDTVYLAVLAAAVLPLFFLKRYRKPLAGKKLAVRIVLLCLLHALFPALLLALSQIVFATPLWVARAFVPDFFLVVVLSSVLLFAGGAAKAGIMIFSDRKASA